MTTDTMTRPVAGTAKPWAPIPAKSRKLEAISLVNRLLTGELQEHALYFIRHRRYSAVQLENFINNMRRGLAAKNARTDG